MDPTNASDMSFAPQTSEPQQPTAQQQSESAGVIPPSPVTTTPLTSKPKKIPFINLFLISGICLFILSIGYYAQTQQSILTSQASPPQKENILPTIVPKTPSPNSSFPTKYKDEIIPKELITSAQSAVTQGQANKDIYIQSMIIKFFVFRDLLTQQDTEYQVSTPDNFDTLVSLVTEMEQKLSKSVLAKADFGYITAHTANAPDPSSQQTAKSLLEGYRESLTSEEYTIQQIVDVAAQDETLVMMGKGKVGGILTDYDSTRALFPQTAEFDDFLFRQKINEVSPIYTLKDLQGKNYALVIVYPTRIVRNKYTSIFKILEEYKDNFSY